MPSDLSQIAAAALRRHTAALNALRFQAEAEILEHARARQDLEVLIERLIAGLDELDGADGREDLEPDLAGFDKTDMADREGEGGRDDDFEPSLGWSVTGATAPADNSLAFCDLEGDEHEDDEEDEHGGDVNDEGEADHAEDGIADAAARDEILADLANYRPRARSRAIEITGPNGARYVARSLGVAS
jgi:hypothetical protein